MFTAADRSQTRTREMAKTKAATDRSGASERIRTAALALFKSHGYHGTPVREIAEAVHIETASLYYHFSSKQEILFDLIWRTLDAMLDGVQVAIASGSTPEERLRAAVRFHVLYHIARQDEAFVSHSELRSLSPANFKRVLVVRDRYEKIIRSLLTAGVRSGAFEIDDVRLASTAILMMCSGVSDWFAGQGRLTAVKVADHYANMVIRLVRAR
jgi:TetR/AcrR family transcriptional regulator, cholesterol catabolism regulator